MHKPTGPGKIKDNLNLPPAARLGVSALLYNFDIDDATVKREHKTWLEANAAPLAGCRSSQIFLKGSASRSGTNDYNMQLSVRRVRAVQDVLLKHGARTEQINLTAVGEEEAALAGEKDGTENELDRAVSLTLLLPRGTGVMRFERVDPTDSEDGFEIDRAPQWLMVPLFDRRALVLRHGEGVRLFTDRPGVVQLVSGLTNSPVNEELVFFDHQRIEFQGNLPGDATIFAQDLITGAVVPLLEISVFFPNVVRVKTHFVLDPQHPTPGRSVQSVRDQFAVANRLFLRQANLIVTATGDPTPLPFTQNLSDPNAPPRNGIQPITGRTVGGETFPVLSARGVAGARINVFYVWEWEPDQPDTQAEADGIPGRNVIYEDDVSAVINGQTFNNEGLTLAHEFGHCLGLEHTGTADPALAARLMFNRSNRRGLLTREEILTVRRNV